METIDSRPSISSQNTEDESDEEEEEEQDLISNLPDSILHHILSFLDMRYVVQTSVLSTRWRDLWASLPHLTFNSDTPGNKNLKTLINKVLILRDQSDLQSFRLFSENDSHVPHVYSWILAAIRRNVQELDIYMSTNDEIEELPQCLFSCASLTVLKLALGCRHPHLSMPYMAGWRNLKTLELTSVTLVDDWATCDFISNCPSLESLLLIDCELNLLEDFVIDAPKLEQLVIQSTFPAYRLDIPECKVKLNAPNLRSFTCDDYMSRDYSLGDLACLNHADIGMEIGEEFDYTPFKAINLPEDEKKEYVQRMIRFLKAVCDVKSLALYAWLLLVVSEPFDDLESLSLQFHNLTYLKLETWPSIDCIVTIAQLLKICPNVETLSLKVTKNRYTLLSRYICCSEKSFTSGNMGEFWEPEECMLHHLKVVEVQGVVGCMNELRLLEFVLKNAVVLEKMVIFTSKDNISDSEKNVLINFSKMLLTLPRASSNIAIFFF